MPLTVGEWRDIVSQRLSLSRMWAVSTSHEESVLQVVRDIFSQDAASFLVEEVSSLPQEPYEPLLSFLKTLQQAQGYDINTLLTQSHTYVLHRSLFEGIYTGVLIHRDILFLEELSFEKYALEEALFHQVEILLGQKKTVWVVSHAQDLKPKMIRFFKRVMEKQLSNLTIFFLASREGMWSSDFTDFWEWLVQEGVAYDVPVTGVQVSGFPKKEINIQEMFSRIRLFLHFFHFEEALFLLQMMRQEIFLPQDEIMYYFFKGISHYYKGEFQQAIEAFHNGLEKSFDISNEDQIRNFQFYLALSYLGQADIEQAYKHIYVVYHHYYSESVSETFGYLFYYLLISLRYQGRWTQELERLMQQVLAEAERWAFANMKAYVLGVYFMESMQAGFVEAKKNLLLQICEEMISLAEKLGNKARLAAAYHNQAMVFSQTGEHEKALVYYHKSLELKKRFQNALELAQIRNGIAYGYLMIEQYDEAIGFLQQNINSMRSTGNLIEILLALVNAGMVLVGTSQYEEAIILFQTIEEMKRIAGISQLPYHSSLELGCYLGLCYAKTHQNLKLFGLFQRLQDLVGQGSISVQEDILWLLFQAYFLREEKRFDELRRVLQKWVLIVAEYRPSVWLLWREGCQLFYEVFPEGSQERVSFQKILSQLREQGVLSENHVQVIMELPPVSPVSLFWSREECFNIAYEFANLQKLEQSLVRMHFLRQVYTIMSSTSLSNYLFQKILKVITSYLPVSSAFFLLLEDFHWQNVASVNDTHVFDPIFVVERVSRDIAPEQRVLNLVSLPYWNKLLPFEANVYLIPLRRRYVWEGALVLLWNANVPPGEESEEILAMLGEYLAVQVYYKKVLDNLRFLNYDITTGFYKGDEIIQQMRRESARIERYGRKLRNFAVAYVMLENFFHFRERYGENLANFFLKRFRQHLERSVREVDMVGYMPEGGVVILFPESLAENVEKFVQRLEDFFESPLRKMKDVQKLLPQEKTHQEIVVNCHIGIVDYHSCPESPETLMHVAKEMALRSRANSTLKETYIPKHT